MRPGRLSEIFDAAGDATFALDQQNIAGSKRFAQGGRLANSERLTVVGRLLQPGNQTSDIVEHPVHDPPLTFWCIPKWQCQTILLPFGYPSYTPTELVRGFPSNGNMPQCEQLIHSS